VDTEISRTEQTFHTVVPRRWTPELIQEVNIVSNKISHTVDFWLDSIVGGYITEFVIDCTQSYSIVEREFFKGPRKILEVIIYLDQDVSL
jgi:hypothetical protein